MGGRVRSPPQRGSTTSTGWPGGSINATVVTGIWVIPCNRSRVRGIVATAATAATAATSDANNGHACDQ